MVENTADDEIERRLHDLTLDFGVVTMAAISRPLQLKTLGEWQLKLWVPRNLFKREKDAREAFKNKRLPLVLPVREFPLRNHAEFSGGESRLNCDNFLEVKSVLKTRRVAAFLPDFLGPGENASAFFQMNVPAINSCRFHYRLAWNPRLLRLNPHASRWRETLLKNLESLYQAKSKLAT